MLVDRLKDVFEKKGFVEFQLYSLVYQIQKEQERVAIFTKNYPNKKVYYNNIDDLIKQYHIFGESILENEKGIKLYNIEEIEIL